MQAFNDEKSCFLYVGSATEPVLSQLHRNCSKWLFTSGELSVQSITGVRCNCIMNQTKPKMPRNSTHTNLLCFGPGFRSYLSCTNNLNSTPALPPGCSVPTCQRAWGQSSVPQGSGVGGRHRGLAELTARESRAPGKQVPFSLHGLHLCHPALRQQLLRVRAWQKEISTITLSQYMPNQGNYSGAVEFLVWSHALTEGRCFNYRKRSEGKNFCREVLQRVQYRT